MSKGTANISVNSTWLQVRYTYDKQEGIHPQNIGETGRPPLGDLDILSVKTQDNILPLLDYTICEKITQIIAKGLT